MQKIILASESFMKNFIMEKSKIEYQKMPADIDETIFDHLDVKERVQKLSQTKCEKIAKENSGAIVIAADTLTTSSNGKIFAKPKDSAEGLQMALSLSGETIVSHTAMTAFQEEVGYKTYYTATEIKYQKFSIDRLKLLADKDNPSIRSGALGLFSDSAGFTLVESFNGSYTGAFGLPMEYVYQFLDLI